VVLEGNARLTAFMLARDRLPPELEVLAGTSPTMTSWGLWQPARRGQVRNVRDHPGGRVSSPPAGSSTRG
jgi:hypothetical protein